MDIDFSPPRARLTFCPFGPHLHWLPTSPSATWRPETSPLIRKINQAEPPNHRGKESPNWSGLTEYVPFLPDVTMQLDRMQSGYPHPTQPLWVLPILGLYITPVLFSICSQLERMGQSLYRIGPPNQA